MLVQDYFIKFISMYNMLVFMECLYPHYAFFLGISIFVNSFLSGVFLSSSDFKLILFGFYKFIMI